MASALWVQQVLNHQQLYPQRGIGPRAADAILLPAGFPTFNLVQAFPMLFIKVALDVPLPTLFDYRFDAATASHIGLRVRVPFGRRHVVGVILEVTATTSVELGKIRPASEILFDVPALPPDIVELLKFCSEYYHHPIGEVALGALPTRFRTAQPWRLPSLGFAITDSGGVALGAGLKRSPALQRVLARLSESGPIRPEAVAQLTTADRRALRRLLANGWISELSNVPTQHSAIAPSSQPTQAISLTPEQRDALRAIVASPPGFRTWLLHGITGSGKTEVYLHTMSTVLAASGQVLFLVPEIGLTPQLETHIRARFPGHALVTLHSGLSAGQRAVNWIAAHSGQARIVLGTRSAIFTPLPGLALILVDEEHDHSFKQIEAMRYSARDLAIWRARQRNVPVILGSATPSLETYQAARNGRYQLMRLTQRANSVAPPAIHLVPLAGVKLAGAIAPSVLTAIRERIDEHEQVLVFINRRGYAPVLACPACGWAANCHRCSARLVLHKAGPRMVCHHCGHKESVPVQCGECGNVDLRPLGYGTQRVEASLRTAIPGARLLRIDRDTTHGRDAWTDLRSSIANREVDILVGTQLLSKGHDFAGLGLVCVLNADRSLYSTSYRASEQLFAQLVQVSGRAGRGRTRGMVLIQTAFPAHPLYRAVQAHDYDAFAESLLSERKQACFPPFVHQAVLRAEAPQLSHALAFLHKAVEASRQIAADVVIFDPAPASLQRLKGHERANLLVQSKSRSSLHRFLDQWCGALRGATAGAARWALDVDPIDV